MRTGKRNKFGDKCSRCDLILNETNASYGVKFAGAPKYLRSYCKYCRKNVADNWLSHNKDIMRGHGLKKYGMSLEEYKGRVELQLGGCAICKQPCSTGQELSVDHDHKTGKTRDLLCKRCNIIIGLCYEDELLLFDIMDYLKRHERKTA